MAKTRRQFAGGAVASTLTGSVAASGVTTFAIASSSGWSTSTSIPFYVVVSPQTSSEEKMLVTLSSNTLTIVSRAVDGTTAASHASGAAIYPVFTATDADEANELTSKYANRGSIVYQGASTFEELVKGTQGYALVAGANDPAWAQVGTTGIADDAITAAKIAANAVGASEIANGSVGTDELASDSVTTAKILDLNVTTGKLADDAVTAAKIASGAVGTTELADTNVTLAKLAAAVANALVPVGTIAPYAGATAPTGWLLCNGTSTSGYTALAALVGATTPDFRGRFLIGDNASLTLLATGGSATISTSNLPAHSHAAGTLAADSAGAHSHDNGTLSSTHAHGIAGKKTSSTSHTHTGTTTVAMGISGGTDETAYTEMITNSIDGATDTAGAHAHTISGSTAETGGASDYYQPYGVVNYIIKHD